jgi:hypothetical protein
VLAVANERSRKVYLHVGLHKSGTTYLQGALRGNRAELAKQGVLVPHGPAGGIFRAVDDVQGRRPRDVEDSRIVGAWQALVTEIGQSDLPRVVISDERLSLSGLGTVDRIRRALEDSELHVIVTVRDLARALVSSWEEAVRGTATWTWQEYVDAVRDPRREGTNPARGFWVRQNLAQICATWETVVPRERMHIVTVPPRGADPRELLRRFAGCLGVDAGRLVEQPPAANEATGVAGTEVIRRLNLRLGDRLNQRQYARCIRGVIAPELAERGTRGVLPREDLEWATARAEQDRAMLRDRGYDIVGDLDDLLPTAPDGRRPDDVNQDELVDAALDALAAMTVKYGRTRATAAAPTDDRGPAAGSRLRAAAFRARRAVLDRGDRGGPLGRLVSVGYRLRALRQERAASVARRKR